MKYIPAEKLLTEIERRMKDYNASIEKYYNKQKSIKAERDSWKWAECKWFFNLINSLQQEQPEVELEKGMEEYFKGWTETNEGIACHYQYVNLNTCRGIARHFYELGLQARKEE